MGLVTLVDMKEYLGIDDTDYDEFLTEQIDVVSDAIELYCKRKFALATYVQTFYGDDYERVTKNLMLYMFPLVSVTSVKVGFTDAEAAAASALDPLTYRVNLPTGILIRPIWGWFCDRVTLVTYQAGYSTVPVLIMNSVKTLVKQRYNLKASGADLDFGSSVQSISIPGTISVAFDYSLKNADRSTPFGDILGTQLNVIDAFRSEKAIVGSGRLEYIA